MEHNYALAEAEIKSVLVRERYYRDSKQWDKLRDSYHPDATKTFINITWYNGDIDGFVHGSREMASKGPTAIHAITPVDVDIKGFKAFAMSIGSISARFERAGIAYDLLSHCRFLSRLQKIDGQSGGAWKLLTMEVIYIYDSIIPAFPQKGQNLLTIENMQGHEVDARMPGIDDEESVKEVMDRNYSWLNS